MRWHCAHGTKASWWSRASRLLERAENLVQWKVMRATWPKQYEEGPLTARALTHSLRIHRSKGNTLCIFPTSKWSILQCSILKNDVESESMWNIAHLACWNLKKRQQSKITPNQNPSRLLEALAAYGNLSGMAFEVYCKEFCSDPNMGFLKTGHCWWCSEHNGRKPKAGKNQHMVHSRCAEGHRT